MRVLLDTNIIIHREANRILNKDIGLLFNWLDKLNYEKWVHHRSMEEISTHKDLTIVETMRVKIDNYRLHKTDSHDDGKIELIREKDKTINDTIDTDILKEVYLDRFDILITEDRGIHRKAKFLDVEERIYTIESFLEKVNAENPELKNYKVLAVKKAKFGEINLHDEFFNSFKTDYIEFERWFNRKAENESYVCLMDGIVKAFLYLKVEDKTENYSNITPPFTAKRRLKIGTFKVESTGYKLGERFLKVIFDNAKLYRVDEIYVTIFAKREEQKRLVYLLSDWGFKYWGEKTTENGIEHVYTRDFSPIVNRQKPKYSYPFVLSKSNKFIVPIYPDYHTDLLPDSILNNESPSNFTENEPYRNAIQKVYISRSIKRDLKSGDIIIFYRTGGYHKSVVTTLAIVENVIQSEQIRDEKHFLQLCRKRSVFSNEDLIAHWNRNPRNRPFIVNFLDVYSLPKRLNMSKLIELGVIANVESAPRGFELISDEQFQAIINESHSETNFIVD